MSKGTRYTKSDFIRLVVSDLDSISSNQEQAKQFLSSEGLNPDNLVSDGLKRIKKMQLQNAAKQTKADMAIAESVKEKAIHWAETLLNQASFSIREFMLKEKLSLNFRNFESLSKEDIKAILVKHFTLKFMDGDDTDTENI
ncbi:hypothetical protein [Sphingobacterium multivorum]|uniref:hypothetical protein n=1 Tax=Sphingobacterium multivorum TaxID=28454 RepID=UPI0036AA827C